MNDRRKKPEPSLASRYLDVVDRFLRRISEQKGALRGLVHMIHLLVVGVRRSQLTRMAAALSYRTIFGLIPIVVIGMLLIAAFASQEQVDHVASSALKFTGLSAVLRDSLLAQKEGEAGATSQPAKDLATAPTDKGSKLSEPQSGGTPQAESSKETKAPEAGGSAVQPLKIDVPPHGKDSSLSPMGKDAKPTAPSPGGASHAEGSKEPKLPDAGGSTAQPQQREELPPELKAWVHKIYDGIKSLPTGPAGLIGILTLFYAAVSMLVEVEKAFNQIYNAPEGRSWIRRITQYWTLLTLGAIFLILSFYVQDRIIAIAKEVTSSTEGHGYRRLVVHSLGFTITVGISTLLLLIVFMIVPNTRVQFMPALIGAVTSAILWESGKWGFARYVAYSNAPGTGYTRFYGAVAILPLFMLWIYCTWLIVLSGLQLASALQTHRVTNADGFQFSVLATFGLVDDERQKNRVKIVDPASVLIVLIAIAERFVAGKPSDHADISAKTGIDEQAVADMLERLAGAGLLLRVVDGEHEGTYALARPPEAITAAPVLLLAQELVGGTRASSSKLLASLATARAESLGGKTIADLMDRPVAPEVLPSVQPVRA